MNGTSNASSTNASSHQNGIASVTSSNYYANSAMSLPSQNALQINPSNINFV